MAAEVQAHVSAGILQARVDVVWTMLAVLVGTASQVSMMASEDRH